MMLNTRDGGANGVKLGYDECETGYNTEKGVECYEKTKANGIVTQPWSTGITLQVLPKTNVDKIPVLAPGYGFSAMTDGKTFQWAFNPPASYWDGADMILQNISGGNLDSLKGKKIVLLHLDHPYGKEPIPLFEALAAKHGFTFLPIPVGLKEMQNQSAQWLQIRRERPDFVLMWGWGAMNAGAITEAVKTKFPMDKFVGIWWSGHDGDLKLVGEAGKGYRSLSWSLPNSEVAGHAGHQEACRRCRPIVESGRASSIPFSISAGVLISMILAEGVKAAQANFNTKVINAEQLRWGLENLKLDEAKLKELGCRGHDCAVLDLLRRSHRSLAARGCSNGMAAKFVKVSDLLKADQSEIQPLIAAKAKEYADANAPWPTNGECKM